MLTFDTQSGVYTLNVALKSWEIYRKQELLQPYVWHHAHTNTRTVDGQKRTTSQNVLGDNMSYFRDEGKPVHFSRTRAQLQAYR